MNRELVYIERYAYCLCFHVKPATIFIGIVNLVGFSLFGLLFLSSMYYTHSNEAILDPTRHGYSAVQRSSAASLTITIYMFCATVSGMLLYGVIKSRPSYLMPFFGIQLFDFFFSLPTFLSSLYTSSAHFSYDFEISSPNSRYLNLKRLWPEASPTLLYTCSLVLTVCFMLFKAYFLCVVWKCYRYLKMKEMLLPLTQNSSGLEIHFPMRVVGQTVSLAPPDYDTATKSSPPPDYETAIKTSVPLKQLTKMSTKEPSSSTAETTTLTSAAAVDAETSGAATSASATPAQVNGELLK